MKLPEFRTSQDQTAASRSTSMSGAFMTPQLRGQTQRHVAPQHNLNIRKYNPEAEGKAAMAKYGVGIAVANAVGEMAEMYVKIDDSAQKMATEKAISEYKIGMAEFASEEILNGGKVDPETGEALHYGSQERYAQFSESLKNEITERNKFSNAEYVHKFGLSADGYDAVNKGNLTDSSQRHIISKGKADYIETQSREHDPVKKLQNLALAEEAMFVTPEFAAQERVNIRVEGEFNGTKDRIDLDNDGVVSSSTMVFMSTPEGIASVGGVDNANRLYKYAVQHKALLTGDTIRRKNMGSVDALTLELGREEQKSTEQLGLKTLEQKDDYLDALKTEINDLKAGMLKKNAESDKATKQGAFSAYTSQIRSDAKFGLVNQPTSPLMLPGTSAAGNKTRYDKDFSERYANIGALAVLSGEVKNDESGISTKEEEMAVMRSTGMISGHVTNAWKSASNRPEQAVYAYGQIAEVMNDPTMHLAVKDKIREELGQDLVKRAVYNTSIGASPELIKQDMLNIQNQRNVQGSDADNTWKAVSKGYDFAEDLRTRLTDMGFNISEQDALGAGVSDYQTMMRINQKSGKYGNNLKNVGDVAMVDWTKKWGVEQRPNGGYSLVKDSWVADTGSTNGQMSANAQLVVDRELATRGFDMEQVAEDRSNDVQYIPAKLMGQDVYAIARIAPDGDEGYKQQFLTDRNGVPLVVGREELVALDNEQQQHAASVRDGVATLGELDKTYITEDGAIRKRQDLVDVVGAGIGSVSRSTNLIGEVIGGAIVDQFGVIKDSIVDVLHAKTMDNPMERQRVIDMLTKGDIAGTSWMDTQTNDEVWNVVLQNVNNELNKREAAREGYVTPEQRVQIMNNTKSVMEESGMTPPRGVDYAE